MSGNTLRVQKTLEGPNYITKELLLDSIRPEWSLKVALSGNYWIKSSVDVQLGLRKTSISGFM